MYKKIGFLIAIAAVILIGYMLWPQIANAPHLGDAEDVRDLSAIPVAAKIVFTEEGYAPSKVTIKKGEKIRFENSADEWEMWPASAVHPTHSIYPQSSPSDCLGSSFDACEHLAPGQAWEFVFDEAGEWRFHDHIHPSKTGVITVTD